MTYLFRSLMVVVLLALLGCNGARSLNDVYGEWSYSEKDGYVVTKIELKLYLDSDVTNVNYGTQYTKAMNKKEYDEYVEKHEGKYGSSSSNLKKELSETHLVFYEEVEGKRDIKLKFKILKSTEKTMTVELLKASKDTRVQSLQGKTLTFQINRDRKKKPRYKPRKAGGFRWGC